MVTSGCSPLTALAQIWSTFLRRVCSKLITPQNCFNVQFGFAAKFARVLFHLAVPFRSIPTEPCFEIEIVPERCPKSTHQENESGYFYLM